MPAQLQLPYPTPVRAASRPSSSALTPQTCPAHVTASTAGRSALKRRARLTAKLAKLAATGQLAPLTRQIAGLGGCAHPIRLTGHRTHLHTATGEILDHFDSGRLPAGELLVRCGNRRATRCPACSTVYRYDTYQLIAAGLRGGKTVPTSVAAHPRVFATLTAPGFGPVHNQPDTGRCHCGQLHADDDPLLGTPLDPERLRLHGRGAVERARPRPVGPLHHPPTPRDRQSRRPHPADPAPPRHALLRQGRRVPEARPGPLPRRHPPRRPHRPHQHPTRLGHRRAPRPRRPRRRQRTRVHSPNASTAARRGRPRSRPKTRSGRRLVFRFGRQIDVRAIRSTDFTGDGPVTDRHVAAYIAKYATKGAETTTGTLDRRLRLLAELAAHDITDHARRMIHTAWHLATTPSTPTSACGNGPTCSASAATSPPTPATTPPPSPTSAPNAPPGAPADPTPRLQPRRRPDAGRPDGRQSGRRRGRTPH